MKQLGSMLIQVILAERFFCADQKKVNQLRVIKVSLLQHLLGKHWQVHCFAFHQMDLGSLYLQFDRNMQLNKAVYETDKQAHPLSLKTEEGWQQLISAVSSIQGGQLKLVADKKIDASQLIMSYQVLLDQGFKPSISGTAESPFSGPPWLRKLRKLTRDPSLFFKDSKSSFLRKLGSILSR